MTRIEKILINGCLFVLLPVVLAMTILGLWQYDLTVPIIYTNADDIWQLILTKGLVDTGWVLNNPYLGAPGIASWHHNSAAQTSPLHSVLMYILSLAISDAIKVQQVYYLLNFSLITISGYSAARLLNINKSAAYVIALLFAFTSFRINYLFYAFIVNYFSVPLVVAGIVLLISGEFDCNQDGKFSKVNVGNLKNLLHSRKFVITLFAVFCVAVSDGYYAFFTLLLLGLVLLIKLLKAPALGFSCVLPSALCILLLLAVVIPLNAPLVFYKAAHPNEFAPNGKQDPALIKQNFEAEVYASSLKLMIAPIGTHRLESFSKIGNAMVESSEKAKMYKGFLANASLGTIGVIGLVCVFLGIFLRENYYNPANSLNQPGYFTSTQSIALFIFLCAISGGVGTLVALVFPTIRAYFRIVVFLNFAVFLYLGGLFSWRERVRRSKLHPMLVGFISLLILGFGIYGQTPKDSQKYNSNNIEKFLAEREFIKAVESKVGEGAMIYQYPYSQYLRKGKYYEWGEFSHVRFYLHSKNLRWSNGGAKNSPADDWNFGISKLPINEIIAETAAAGFSGILVDRRVLSDLEFANVKDHLLMNGGDLVEDPIS